MAWERKKYNDMAGHCSKFVWCGAAEFNSCWLFISCRAFCL